MDGRVKFADSRSNGSRDIRGTVFVSNEHIEGYHIRQNRLTGVRLKTKFVLQKAMNIHIVFSRTSFVHSLRPHSSSTVVGLSVCL